MTLPWFGWVLGVYCVLHTAEWVDKVVTREQYRREMLTQAAVDHVVTVQFVVESAGDVEVLNA